MKDMLGSLWKSIKSTLSLTINFKDLLNEDKYKIVYSPYTCNDYDQSSFEDINSLYYIYFIDKEDLRAYALNSSNLLVSENIDKSNLREFKNKDLLNKFFNSDKSKFYLVKYFKELKDEYIYEEVNHLSNYPKYKARYRAKKETIFMAAHNNDIYITYDNDRLVIVVDNYNILNDDEKLIYNLLIDYTGYNSSNSMTDERLDIIEKLNNNLFDIDFYKYNPNKLSVLLYSLIEHYFMWDYNLFTNSDLFKYIYSIKSSNDAAYKSLLALSRLLLDNDGNYILLKQRSDCRSLYYNPYILRYLAIVSPNEDYPALVFMNTLYSMVELYNVSEARDLRMFFNNSKYILDEYPGNTILKYVYDYYISHNISDILKGLDVLSIVLEFTLIDVSTYFNLYSDLSKNKSLYSFLESNSRVRYNSHLYSYHAMTLSNTVLTSIMLLNQDKRIISQDNRLKNPILYIYHKDKRISFIKTSQGYRLKEGFSDYEDDFNKFSDYDSNDIIHYNLALISNLDPCFYVNSLMSYPVSNSLKGSKYFLNLNKEDYYNKIVEIYINAKEYDIYKNLSIDLISFFKFYELNEISIMKLLNGYYENNNSFTKEQRLYIDILNNLSNYIYMVDELKILEKGLNS